MTVSIGTVAVSRETPRIVAALGPGDVKGSGRVAAEMGADILELRADLFPDLRNEAGRTAVVNVAKRLKKAAAAPLLVTVRGRAEGGAFVGGEAARAKLYLSLLEHAEAVDVELKAAETRDRVLAAARERDIPTVLSYHNFEACPSDKVLEMLLDSARYVGASITKIAVTPQAQTDVIRLLSFLNRQADREICLIGMGAFGRVSRLLFPVFGSRLTYGHTGGKSVAPGQMSVADIRAVLDLVS